jgi:hypothetical protein
MISTTTVGGIDLADATEAKIFFANTFQQSRENPEIKSERFDVRAT